MTQKPLKPRKKSGLGKTQNVASEAVRVMALSQRGRISKPQQGEKKTRFLYSVSRIPKPRKLLTTENKQAEKQKKTRRTTNGYETFSDYAE
jgi:hypothetical protein